MHNRLYIQFYQFLKLCVITSSLSLAACGGIGSDSDDLFIESGTSDSSANAKRIQPTSLFKSTASVPWFHDKPADGNIVIENASDWSTLWLQVQKANRGSEPQPAINFQNHIVVGITRQLPDGCSAALISQIDQQNKQTIVEVQTRGAEAGAFCTQQVTYGIHLVKVKKPRHPILFTDIDQ